MSEEALRTWAQLGRRQKIALAKKVAFRRRRELEDLPNVVAVGYGIRFQGGRWTGEPCIRVVVSRKWKTRARRAGRIPALLTTTATVRRRRRRVQVPLDIEAAGAPKLQGATGGVGCTAAWKGLDEKGTGCCLVRWGSTNSPERYLLSCHHVLALSLTQPFPPRSEWDQVRVSVGPEEVGHLAEIAYLRFADAAIAEVTGDSVSAMLNFGDSERLPSGRVSSVAMMPLDYVILGKSGVLPYRLSDIRRPHVQPGYHGGTDSYSLKEVLVSAPTSGAYTQGGDSGAPLVDKYGRILGLHFAGDSSGLSYAIPIGKVFEAFDPPLTLVRS